MNDSKTYFPGGKKIRGHSLLLQICSITVLEIQWTSQSSQCDELQDIGLFCRTQELGGTWTSGKSCALQRERHNSPCDSSKLLSMHLLYSSLCRLMFSAPQGHVVKYGCPESASYSSSQMDRLLWPFWLQF